MEKINYPVFYIILLLLCVGTSQGQEHVNKALPDSLSIPLLEIDDPFFTTIFDSLQMKKEKCVFANIGTGTYGTVAFLDNEEKPKQLRLGINQISFFFMEKAFAGYDLRGAFYYNNDNDLVLVRLPCSSSWCEEKFNQIFRETRDSVCLHFDNIRHDPHYKDANYKTVVGKIGIGADYYMIIYEEINGEFLKIKEETCITDMENYRTF